MKGIAGAASLCSLLLITFVAPTWSQPGPAVQLPLIRHLKTDIGGGVVFSPTSNLLATGCTTCAKDGGIALWDAPTGHLVRIFPVPGGVYGFGMMFSPNGALLAGIVQGSRNRKPEGRLWDVRTGRLVWSPPPWAAIESFSPDSRLVVVLDREWYRMAHRDPPEVWNFGLRRLVRTLSDDRAATTAVFSRDGTTLALGGDQNTWGIRLRDIRTGRLIREFPTPFGSFYLGLPRDERLILSIGGLVSTGPHSWDVAAWALRTGRQSEIKRGTVYNPAGEPAAAALRADGNLFVVAYSGFGGPTTLEFVDLSTLRTVATFETAEFIESVAFSGDGRMLATTSHDTAGVDLWDVSTFLRR